jgi:hypothetical protein
MTPNKSEPVNTPTGSSETKEDEHTASRVYFAVKEGKTEPMTINAIPKKTMPIQAAMYTKVLLYLIQSYCYFVIDVSAR